MDISDTSSFSLAALAKHFKTSGQDKEGAVGRSSSDTNSNDTDRGDWNNDFFDHTLFADSDKNFDAGIWSPSPYTPSRVAFAGGPLPMLDLKTTNEEAMEAACRDAFKFGIIRLFVHNLPPGTRWQDLKDHFGRFGNVQYASVYVDPECPGECFAYGFVVMSSVAETIAILRYDKPHYINGCRGMIVELFRSGNGKYSNGFWTAASNGSGEANRYNDGFRGGRNSGNYNMYPSANYRRLPSSYNGSPGRGKGKLFGRKGPVSNFGDNYISDDFDFESGNNQYKRYMAGEKTNGNHDLEKTTGLKQSDSFFDTFGAMPAAGSRPSPNSSNGVPQQQPFAYSNRIMVSNMSLDTEWRDVKLVFEQFGPVKFVYVNLCADGRESPQKLPVAKLSGYVDMENEEDATMLLAFDGTIYIRNTAVEVRPYDGVTPKTDAVDAAAAFSKSESAVSA